LPFSFSPAFAFFSSFSILKIPLKKNPIESQEAKRFEGNEKEKEGNDFDELDGTLKREFRHRELPASNIKHKR